MPIQVVCCPHEAYSIRKRFPCPFLGTGPFGRVFEADFVALITSRGTGVRDVFKDAALSKKLKPRITVDGEEWRYHYYRGHAIPVAQCGVILADDAGDAVRLVVHKSPQEMEDGQGQNWQLSFELDCRVSALVSLIKAAYLTLFHLNGYGYALSARGLSVGYDLLGDFYRQNRDKEVSQVKEAARDYFKRYVHMVRPIERVDGTPPVGTIEDHRAKVCFGSSGRPFALVVLYQHDQELHAVMMPFFAHPDSAAAFFEFLNNDRDTLRASECVFNPNKNGWEIEEQPAEMVWPKEGGTFERCSF